MKQFYEQELTDINASKSGDADESFHGNGSNTSRDILKKGSLGMNRRDMKKDPIEKAKEVCTYCPNVTCRNSGRAL